MGTSVCLSVCVVSQIGNGGVGESPGAGSVSGENEDRGGEEEQSFKWK